MNIRVPVSWLREYIKTDVAAKTLAGYLSLSGPSVERLAKQKGDIIYQIEATSNRHDLASVFGLAREANTILSYRGEKSQLVPPKGLNLILDPDTSSPLPLDVLIRNKSLCPRFTAIVVDNVKIEPSPALIRKRLEASGIRAINNMVDIANYIMLELGQPMHTFDYDKIKKNRMILRESNTGEKIKTLDGQVRKLPQNAIVIEDDSRLIDLCGIMGGENSQITRRTKRVVLFVQAYNRINIRKTTQFLSFRTEAAARFEKGVDIEAIPQALARAVYLSKKIAGAKIASELIDICQESSVTRPEKSLAIDKLNSYLGIDIKQDEAQRILNLLGFSTTARQKTILATPPSWRTGDIQDDVDLIEEIARIYGYWRLPSQLPAGVVPDVAESELSKVIELKKALKFLGLTEVITYSIISKDLLSLMDRRESKAVELANPLTEEWQFMRPSIIPSLVQVIAQNQNTNDSLRIFEVAKTYEPREKDIPTQDIKIAFALSPSSFFDIKGLVENLFDILKRKMKFEKFSGNNPLSQNSQFALIKVDGKNVGGVGILNNKVTNFFSIEKNVYVAEINLTEVFSQTQVQPVYHPIPKYPPVIEDISAIFDLTVPVAEIVADVKKSGSPLVKKIGIIDIFTNEKIGKDKKSITLRLTHQRSDRTPSQEEVTAVREKISAQLTKTFHAQIRK